MICLFPFQPFFVCLALSSGCQACDSGNLAHLFTMGKPFGAGLFLWTFISLFEQTWCWKTKVPRIMANGVYFKLSDLQAERLQSGNKLSLKATTKHVFITICVFQPNLSLVFYFISSALIQLFKLLMSWIYDILFSIMQTWNKYKIKNFVVC